MAESGEATKPEVEKFLLAKLEAGLAKKVPRRGSFEKIKKTLENELETAPDEKAKGRIREKLYRLNSIMNEKYSSFDCFRWSLSSSLKQLKKDIKSAQTTTTAEGSLKEKLYRLMNEKCSSFDCFRLSLRSSLKEDIKSAQTTTADGNQRAPTAAAAAAAEERSTRTMTMKALGIEADELAMENLLLHQIGIRREFFNVVGIIGAEGVGKTTLAQSIFAKEEVAERFRPRIWISMADDPAKEEENLQIAIAKRILLALGISDDIIKNIRGGSTANEEQILSTANEEQILSTANEKQILAHLIHAIRLELMGKPYLVVLDDASMKDSYRELSSDDKSLKEWYTDLRSDPTPNSKLEDKLGFAFPKGSGGTILVIGWPENVVKEMLEGDESAIHRLLPLEDPKLCWDICEDEAKEEGKPAVSESDKPKVEAEVVKRSNGLPAAARLMGKIVKKVKRDSSTNTSQSTK